MGEKITMSAHNKNKRLVYRKGKKTYERFTFQDYVAPLLLIFSLAAGTTVHIGATTLETGTVRAAEPTTISAEGLEPTYAEGVVDATVPPTKSTPSVEELIAEVFGDQADNALKIAKCESGMNPETIGDKHLMGMLDGEMIGDSIGLFQIRTGDAGVYDKKPWNRAKANGMTVEEFRVYLKNPENNVRYAKKMFDRQGWGQWFNCKNKTGVK